MKTLIYFAFLTFISIVGYCQTEFICYSGNGKMELASGEIIEGTIEFCLSSPAKVRIVQTEQTEKEKYKSDEVKQFNIEDKHYLSVSLKGGVSVGNSDQFARVLTPADWKVKVFMTETQPSVVVSVSGEIPITVSYYCSIPGDNNLYELSNMKFTPFKKMAKYLADCPSVAAKINNKEEGYFVSMIATDAARKEVFLNVAKEYQNCK